MQIGLLNVLVYSMQEKDHLSNSRWNYSASIEPEVKQHFCALATQLNPILKLLLDAILECALKDDDVVITQLCFYKITVIYRKICTYENFPLYGMPEEDQTHRS